MTESMLREATIVCSPFEADVDLCERFEAQRRMMAAAWSMIQEGSRQGSRRTAESVLLNAEFARSRVAAADNGRDLALEIQRMSEDGFDRLRGSRQRNSRIRLSGNERINRRTITCVNLRRRGTVSNVSVEDDEEERLTIERKKPQASGTRSPGRGTRRLSSR